AGEHVLAGGVDDLGVGGGVQVRADRGDRLILAVDVGDGTPAGRDDIAVLDQQAHTLSQSRTQRRLVNRRQPHAPLPRVVYEATAASVDVDPLLAAILEHRVPVGRDFGAGLHQFVPRNARPERRNGDHGDATIHGAHEAAQVATDAILFAHLRLRLAGVIRQVCRGDGVGGRVDDGAVDREVDALMRALIAGYVTQVALDAGVVVDARDR